MECGPGGPHFEGTRNGDYIEEKNVGGERHLTKPKNECSNLASLGITSRSECSKLASLAITSRSLTSSRGGLFARFEKVRLASGRSAPVWLT